VSDLPDSDEATPSDIKSEVLDSDLVDDVDATVSGT
jgi:hypothetical protein